MNPFVLRTNLQRPPWPAISLLNERQASARPFEPAEVELQRMAMQKPERLQPDDVEAWIHHPDELVTITFLRIFGPWLQAKENSGKKWVYQSLDTVCERAEKDADEAGETWTPLIDALSMTLGQHWAVRRSLHLETRAKAFTTWAKTVEDPEELRGLADLTSVTARYCQMDKARCIPEDLMDYWIQDTWDAERILRNDAIMRASADAVLRRIITHFDGREITTLVDAFKSLKRAHLKTVSADTADLLLREGRDLGKGRVVAAVIGRCPKVRTASLLDARSAPFLDPELLAAIYVHPKAPPEIRNRFLSGETPPTEKMLAHPDADPAILKAAWKHSGPTVAMAVLYHPRVPVRLAHDIIKALTPADFRTVHDLPPVAKNLAVAFDLLQVASPPMVRLLIERLADKTRRMNANPQFRVVFAHAIERLFEGPQRGDEASEALDTIELRASKNPVFLLRETVARLLEDPDRQVRERMLILSGSVEHVDSPHFA